MGRGIALMMVLLACGCASTVTGITQTVNLDAFDRGSPVSGASCQLANDKGSWTVTAPGSVVIARSARDLTVKCEKPGLQPAVAIVHSSMSPVGTLDKAIDALTESTRVSLPGYPNTLKLEFGRSIEIGQRAN